VTDKPTDIPDINSREAVVINYLKTNAFITNKKICELLSILYSRLNATTAAVK